MEEKDKLNETENEDAIIANKDEPKEDKKTI